MILNEAYIDGINNSTVLLKQKNHEAVMKLKYNYQNLCKYYICFRALYYIRRWKDY